MGPSVALRNHGRQRVLAQEQRAAHVHRQTLVQQFNVQVHHRRFAIHACVANENVDAPKMVQRRGYQALNVLDL